jgi:POT family proton-dependent oligopeptide transporter
VNAAQQRRLKQPRVLYLSFLTAMSERFGYYIIGFLLTLYIKSVYGFSDETTFTIFAVFTALGYLTPAIGGYLADNYIGIRRCMLLGLVLEGLGYALLAIPTPSAVVFNAALGAIIVGAGIFKTAPTNILGRSYDKDDPRIDSGFTLYYMGINIGSLGSALITGSVQKAFGWHMPFAFAALGLFVGVVWFVLFRHHAEEVEPKPGKQHFSSKKWTLTIAGSAAAVAFFAYLMSNTELANICFAVGSIAVILDFVYEIIRSPRAEKVRIIVCLALIFMAVVFFMLYFQLYTSMELFINRNVERTVFGYEIPTFYFLGLNGFWIIALSPIYAWFYRMLERKKKDPAITTKMPLGIMLIGTCFIALYVGCTFFARPDAMISGLWMVLAIFLYSAGELLTSALGVAMITRIAPQRMYGIMMGAWYLIGVALAADLSGELAGLASVPEQLQANQQATLVIYSKAFLIMGLFGIAASVLGLIIGPWLKRAAKI